MVYVLTIHVYIITLIIHYQEVFLLECKILNLLKYTVHNAGVMFSLLVSLLLLPSVSSISSAYSPGHREDEYIHHVHVGMAILVQHMCEH